MKLKSFGCSHIWGSDLIPDNSKTPSLKTWPALLAQHFDLEYECFALPGAGNLYIAEQLLTEAEKDPALFVINWTYIDRFDYVDPATNCWATARPGNRDRASDVYYRSFHSEYRDKLTSLMQIKLCIDTLTQKRVPFIMCNTDSLLFETKWHTSEAIKELQKSIQPYILTFDNKNFIEYAKENGHPVSAHDHILESGHAACKFFVKRVKILVFIEKILIYKVNFIQYLKESHAYTKISSRDVVCYICRGLATY